MYCKRCGNQIDDNAYECAYCGEKTGKAMSNAPVNSNLGNTVLAILSMVMSFITFTILGTMFAIVGMANSIIKKDFKGIKLNLVAMCICTVICIAILLLA